MKLTEKQIAEFKEKYGHITIISSEELDRDFAFRPIKRLDVSRFTQSLQTDNYKAFYNLVMDCCVFPDRDTMASLVEQRPMMPMILANTLMADAGLGEVLVKKV